MSRPILYDIPPKFDRARLAARFWKFVDKTGPHCWLWKGTRSDKGYGRFFIAHGWGVYAHRVAWILTKGPIPDGKLVLHKCDVPLCVRCLYVGTQIENMRDRSERGRTSRLNGEKNPFSKLTAKQVKTIRRRYERGDIFQRELAAEFGVDRTQISQIVIGRAWKHL